VSGIRETLKPEKGVKTDTQVEAKLVIPPGRMLEVFGERDTVLRRVEELVECEVIVRGNEIVLRGTEAAVDRAEVVFDGLIGLAEVYVRMERYEDALRLIEEEIGHGPVDVDSSASPRMTLVDALIGLGRYADAETQLRLELTHHLEERNRWAEANVLVRRALVERDTGRVAEARATLHEVAAILDEVGELDRTALTRERVEELLASVSVSAGRDVGATATQGLGSGVALRP
jgi:hypothetical protein